MVTLAPARLYPILLVRVIVEQVTELVAGEGLLKKLVNGKARLPERHFHLADSLSPGPTETGRGFALGHVAAVANINSKYEITIYLHNQ